MSRLLFTLLLACPAWAQISGLPGINAIRAESRLRVESRAGNSVDTGTGAFLVEQEVLTVQGARALPFILSYNSLLTANSGALGFGWAHNYMTRLSIEGNQAIVWWDHTRLNVFLAAGSDAFTGSDEAVRYDRITRNSNGSYTLRRLDGSVYEFLATGRLNRLGNKVNQFVELQYDSMSRLERLREPISGRALKLSYHADRPTLLLSVVDDLGRTVHFDYDEFNRLRAIRYPATPVSGVGIDFQPVAIPDNNLAGVSQPLAGRREGPVGLVRIDSGSITHPRPADLRVFLVAPSGREIALPVPSLNNEGALVFSGQIIGGFEGENGAGVWRVRAVDQQQGQTGTLNPWRIAISGPTYPTRLTYDSQNRILSAIDSLGAPLFAVTYDASGRVVTQDDGRSANLVARFAYQETGNTIITTYTDRTGAAFVFEHDSRYRLLRATDALQQTMRFEYDANGNRVRRTDQLGRNIDFAYDADGNLVGVTDPARALIAAEYDSGRNITSLTDALGRRTTFQYDGNNNMTAVTDAKGFRDRRPYNGNSQLAGTLLQDGGGINYGYAGGMPVSASHPVSGNVNSAYDAAGRLTRITDADGFVTQLEYDDRDNVVRRTDPLGRVRQFTFDHRNRQERIIEPSGDVSLFSYDGNDNLIARIDPLGRTIRFDYDGEDRRTTITDPAGNKSSLTYDAVGRRIAETDALGNTTRAEYDAAGNLTATRNPLGVVVERRSYDVRDNVVETVNALGAKTATRYDLLGRPFEVRNALNEPLFMEYDELDRPVSVRDALGRAFRREYFEDDVVRTQTGPAGAQIRFFYDPANRPTGMETFFGSSSINYNNRDLVTRSVTESGRRTNLTYDSAGQILTLTRTSTTAGEQGNGETLDYSYDTIGNLTVVSRRESPTGPILGRLRREFDAGRRLTRVIDEENRNISYVYDAADNLTRLTYPDGSAVAYAYDAARRLTRVTDWAGRVTRFTWDAAGRLTAVRFPNGAERRLEYDAAGRVSRRLELARSGAVIASLRYAYDASGRLLDEGGAAAPSSTGREFLATATNDNRLATAPLLEATQNLGYDRDGNLTSGSIDGTISEFRYDTAGRLVQTSNATYGYDVEDRLTSIRFRTSAPVSLAYNPNARLSQVLASTQSGQTTRYVHGIGLLYSERNGEILVHHFDERGSTIGLSGASGEQVGAVLYSPFGRVLERSGQTDTLFLYHGLFGVVSSADGLLWMRYRWYSPELHRFLGVDSRLGEIAQPSSLNRYVFVGNAPGLRVDPDGEFWWVAVGALVGAAANVAVQAASDIARGKVSDWQTYAGAAASGAVVGAGVALCPACGLIGSAAIGAAGATVGYLTSQGLRGDRVDAGDLASEALIGGAAGGVAGGAGRLGSKAIGKLGSKLGPKFLGPLSNSGKAAARRAVYGRLDIAGRALKQETGRGLIRGALVGGFTEAAERSGLGAAIENGALTSYSWFSGALSRLPAQAQQARTRYLASQEGTGLLNRDAKGVYGEYLIWQSFIESIQLAGRPAPDVSSNVLTTF